MSNLILTIFNYKKPLSLLFLSDLPNSFLVFLIIISNTLQIHSNNKSPEQLSMNNQKKKVDNLLDKAHNSYRKNPDSTIYYSKKAIKLAKNVKYNKGLGDGCLIISQTYYEIGNLKEAEKYGIDCLDYYSKLDKISLDVINAHMLLGVIYVDMQKTHDALKALLYAKTINNYNTHNGQSLLGLTFTALSYLYINQNDYETALVYANQVISLAEKINSNHLLAEAYSIVGLIQTELDKGLEAIKYFEKEKAIWKEADDALGIIICNNNIAIAHYKANNYLKTIEILELTTTQTEKHGYHEATYEAYCYLAKAYTAIQNLKTAEEILNKTQILCENKSLNKYEWLIAKSVFLHKQKNHNSALDLLIPAYKSPTLTLKTKHQIGKEILTHYRSLESYQKTFSIIDPIQKTNDSILNTFNNTKVELLKTEFDLKEKNKRLQEEKLKLKIETEKANSNRLQYQFALASLITIIILSTLFFWKYKRHQKAEKKIKIMEDKILKEKIEYNQKEVMNLALHITEKNELLESIKKDLNRIKINDRENSERKKQLIHSINQYLRLNQEKITLHSSVDEAKTSFHEKITRLYPSLTNTEKKVIILVKMGWSTKEIATQLGLAISSVENYRHSFRKKMQIPKSYSSKQFLQDL